MMVPSSQSPMRKSFSAVAVLVLSPKVPNFRWLIEGSDSLFYSSLRLLRQSEISNWNDIITGLEAEIRRLLTN